jgi:hypothetical protein
MPFQAIGTSIPRSRPQTRSRKWHQSPQDVDAQVKLKPSSRRTYKWRPLLLQFQVFNSFTSSKDHQPSLPTQYHWKYYPIAPNTSNPHNHHNHVLHHPNTLQLLHPSHPRRFPLRNHPSRLWHGPPHVRNKKPILHSNASHKPRHLEI